MAWRKRRIGSLEVPAADYMSREQAEADDTVDLHERPDPDALSLERRYYYDDRDPDERDRRDADRHR